MMRLPFRTPAEIREALPRVVEHLQADGLLAYPTETVYGFGGAVTEAATARLRALKSREAVKPFLLLIDGPEQVAGVHWSDAARTLARLFWPGPLTLALPADEGSLPDGVRSSDGAVALRATPHPGARAILQAWGAPITSTSANARGVPPATNGDAAASALEALDADDVLLLDGGELPPSPSSTILACEDARVRVLRAGAITAAELRSRLEGTGIDVA